MLSHPSPALTDAEELAAAYQMINSSVGALSTTTLQADSKALASGSASDDTQFADTESALQKIADRRDRLATEMKDALARAAAGQKLNHGTSTSLIAQARNLLRMADQIG